MPYVRQSCLLLLTDAWCVAIQGEGDEEEQKRRRQSAKGYQKRFISSHGDAITTLNVLCAYQQAQDPHAFCR